MKAKLILLSLLGLISMRGSAQFIQIDMPLRPAIVRLHDTMTGSFFCSGTVISEQLIVSAAHCMDDHPLGITIMDMQGQPTGSRVMDILAHGRSDQALLVGFFPGFEHIKMVTEPKNVLKLLNNDSLEVCGFPYAGPLFCEHVNYKGIDIFQFRTDGAAWPGMSGGPVIDRDTGYIVGVITAMSPDGMILSPTVNIYYNLGLVEVK